jgi:hypothetical protein
MGGTYTREQIEEFRGALNPVAIEEPVANGSHDHEPLGTCHMCSAPLYRADQKWCSQACRNRSRTRIGRAAHAVLPQEAPEAEAVDDSPSERPGLLSELLLAGATLTFSLDGVVFTAERPFDLSS